MAAQSPRVSPLYFYTILYLPRQKNQVKSGFPFYRKKKKLKSMSFLKWNPAATYSPGPFPAKYHQRVEA